MHVTRDRDRLRRPVATASLVLLVPASVQAHLVNTPFGDFYGGVLHPLTALGHVLPMLALGLFAGFQPVRSGRWVLLAFPVGLLAGLGLAPWIPSLTPFSALNLASFIVLGALVASAWHLPRWALIGLSLVFGIGHGYENGLAMTETTNATLFVAGVATAGYIVVALIAAAISFLARERPWFRLSVRAAGSWIAAVGVMLMGVSLAKGL